MRSLFAVRIVLFAQVLSVVFGSEVPTEIKNIGDSFMFTIETLGHNVNACYLETPTGLQIQFLPEDVSDDRFLYSSIPILSDCSVTIKNLDENDNGVWSLTYEYENESITETNTRKVKIQIISEGHSSEEEIFDEVEDNVTWLSEINHRTRTDMYIDITLSKTAYEEECILRTPNGHVFKAGNNEIEGVTTQSSSNFVSCRVTIGPMNENLLGNWSLCGTHEEDEIEHKRCQPVNISWRNNNNPSTTWQTTRHPTFNHVVNFNGVLNPTMYEVGDVSTCHIVTPNGEDLVLTADSDYPSINRISFTAYGICSVEIGPIDASMLGNWTIYARYTSILNPMFETQRPLHLYLYNEDNPYEQAYNVSVMESTDHIVNLGSTIVKEVQTDLRRITQVDSCTFKSPSGETSLEGVSFTDVGSRVVCSLSVGPITKNMIGEWQIIGKFSNQHNFEEVQHTFHIIQEDPANPVQDDTRTVETLDEEFLNTTIGSSHEIFIRSLNNQWDGVDSCHIRTPDGLQYRIMEGFNVPGVEVVEAFTACRIKITLISEDVIGEWTLILRETLWLSGRVEKRLPFTVYVEEYVNASPKLINIAEGSDLYVRLETPTILHETCKLLEPSGNSTLYEIDERHIDTCGFIVKYMTTANSGTWEITYGIKTTYRALIEVKVNERWTGKTRNLVWIQDNPIEELIGPDDAVYCRIEDPTGSAILDGFGRCKIDLEKATLKHNGIWKMIVGLSGRVLTDEYEFYVNVMERNQSVVNTQVDKDAPSVTLSCTVPSTFNVRACKFREPSGRVLLSTQGIGEDRYTFHETEVSFRSVVHEHSCGIRIISPVASDLGLWRCAVETDGKTYYGFLSVLCPWAMQDPTVAASVISKPTLTVDDYSSLAITAIEGDAVTMSCSIQSAIKYCYFRSQNGTVFSVGPSTSTESAEYVGAGFEAGECGIRFKSLFTSDSGRWSCHVGFHNTTEPEQRANINLSVKDAMILETFYDPGNDYGTLYLDVRFVHEESRIEYCRFVRIDGLGFTERNAPDGYMVYTYSVNCMLAISNATILDQHPWTVVAKLEGQTTEVSKVSDHVLEIPEFPQNKSYIVTWIVFSSMLMLALLIVGLLTIPKKNRKWVAARASIIRSSLSKKPLPDQNIKETNTPVVA